MDDLKRILERIDQRLELLDMTRESACKKAALSRDAIRNWHRAVMKNQHAKPNLRSIEQLAPVLHTSINWLLTGAPTDPQVEQRELISEIDPKACGQSEETMRKIGAAPGPILFDRNLIRDYWRIPKRILARFDAEPGEIAAFAVEGDSMKPTLIDGDIAFIDMRHRRPSPDGLYALCDDFGYVIIKRLEIVSEPGAPDPRVKLISDNSRHEPKIRQLSVLFILGRYIGKFTSI